MKKFIIIFLFFIIFVVSADGITLKQHVKSSYIAVNLARVSKSESIIRIVNKNQKYKSTTANSYCGRYSKVGARKYTGKWSNGSTHCSILDKTGQSVNWFK